MKHEPTLSAKYNREPINQSQLTNQVIADRGRHSIKVKQVTQSCTYSNAQPCMSKVSLTKTQSIDFVTAANLLNPRCQWL